MLLKQKVTFRRRHVIMIKQFIKYLTSGLCSAFVFQDKDVGAVELGRARQKRKSWLRRSREPNSQRASRTNANIAQLKHGIIIL